MMRFVTGLALAGLMLTPACAAQPMALDLTNNSSLTVTALNTFPIGKDGEPVEDNLGALMEEVPPGGTARLELSLSRCATILAVVVLDNRTEGRIVVDLCKDKVLTLHD